MQSSHPKLYLIGSLRNKRIPILAKALRKELPGVEIFDDWYSAGPEADDEWKTYEQARGRTYGEALNGHSAKHVFSFDRGHLDTSSHVLLVLPAGKSGHMEVMYAAYGTDAHTAILLDPEDVRWDVMYQFVPTVLNNDKEIKTWVNQTRQDDPQGMLDLNLTVESPRSYRESYITSHGPSLPSPKFPSSVQTNIYGTVGSQFPTESRDTPRRAPGM